MVIKSQLKPTNMTKLKVDLKNGLLEIEGDDAFVREIYGDYKDVLAHIISRQNTDKTLDAGKPEDEVRDTPPKAPKPSKSKNRTGSNGPETHKIIGSLNLEPADKKSLRAFVAEKKPRSNQETNLVIVYYLEKVLGITGITPDHVYTCYKNINEPTPVLVTSLRNTASAKGWINTSESNNILVTTLGENMVEHDLPAPEKGK